MVRARIEVNHRESRTSKLDGSSIRTGGTRSLSAGRHRAGKAASAALAWTLKARTDAERGKNFLNARATAFRADYRSVALKNQLFKRMITFLANILKQWHDRNTPIYIISFPKKYPWI